MPPMESRTYAHLIGDVMRVILDMVWSRRNYGNWLKRRRLGSIK